MKKLIIFSIFSFVLLSCSTTDDYIVVLTFSKQLHTTIYDSNPSSAKNSKEDNTKNNRNNNNNNNRPSSSFRVVNEGGEKVLNINSRIYFDFNSYELRDDSKPALDDVYNYLVRNKNHILIIEGDADSSGDYYYNIYLSEMRARAIASYLNSKNIEKNRLKYIGFGSTKVEGRSRRDSRSARFVVVNNNEDLNRYRAKNESGDFIKVRGLY